MFTIGRFSGLCGVSPKTLREYDRLGIFRPAWVDTDSGYRRYSPAQLPDIRRIVALRDLGVSLSEISRLQAGGVDRATVLAARRAELESERDEVARRLAALDIDIPALDTPVGLDIVLRWIEPMSVAAIDASRSGLNAAFYRLESVVRDAGRRAHRPPGALLHDRADATSDASPPFVRVEAFVPITGRFGAPDDVDIRRLPEGRAATVIVRGAYGALRHAQAATIDWVSAAGLRRTGSIRILYLQFGAEPELRLDREFLVDRDEDFVTELQLPVG